MTSVDDQPKEKYSQVKKEKMTGLWSRRAVQNRGSRSDNRSEDRARQREDGPDEEDAWHVGKQ